MKARIVFLPGDGIGPEVLDEARLVLNEIERAFGHSFEIVEGEIGVRAITNSGDPLPDTTRDLCMSGDAVMLGAVGGPTGTSYNGRRPEAGLLDLRTLLGNYANLRPVVAPEALAGHSPLRPELIRGVDLLVVRELLGGIYFGKPSDTIDGVARDTEVYSEHEVRRIAVTAFTTARLRRKKVTSVDKANVLESSRMWREVTTEVGKEYPDVELEHQLVDSCAMLLITQPTRYDVMVMENTFGDILSDEAAVLAASLGMLPSASLAGLPGNDSKGKPRKVRGLYEPSHGTAPDIVGTGKANPIGTILSAAFMLQYSFGLVEEANAVNAAVNGVIEAGHRTADIAARGAGFSTTDHLTDLILDRL